MLLRQAIEGPDEGGRQHRQHPGGIGGQRGQQLTQALIEEQAEAQQHDHQGNRLTQAEAFAKDEQAADQQEYRRHLDHQLRGPGAEQIESDQIQHVVGRQPADSQRQQPTALASQRPKTW